MRSDQNQNEKAKPFLRWAGSKRKLLPAISELLPSTFDRYIEPFAGSACLYFHLTPQNAILGDINEDLINTYLQVQHRPDAVNTKLELLNDSSPSTYYRIRAIDPNDLSPIERAARFIYLNRLCFNGLYRTNLDGKFNVPYGGERSGNFPTLSEISSASKVLRNARLIGGSFEKVLAEVKSGDFVYLDPPYSIANRRVFNNYSNDVFGLNNLTILRCELERLNRNGIPFLLSYGLSKEGLTLAKGFRIRHKTVQRQISGFATYRKTAREMLVTNF